MNVLEDDARTPRNMRPRRLRSATIDHDRGDLLQFLLAGWASLTVFIAALVVSTTIYLVAKYHSPLPIWDEWMNVDNFRDWIDNHYPLEDLTRPHNEHRIFFPRLVFFSDYLWFGGRLLFTTVITLAVQILHAMLFVTCLYLSRGKSQAWLGVAAAIVVLLFTLRQVDDFVWKFELQFILVYAAATWSMVAFVTAVDRIRHRRSPLLALIIAFTAALICNFSMVNGLWSNILLVVLAIVTRSPRWLLALALVFATSMVMLYFYGYVSYTTYPDASDVVRFVLAFTQFIAAYIGNPIGRNPYITQWLGFWGLTITAAAALVVLRDGGTNLICAAMLGVILFVLGSAAITAIGRMGGGLEGSVTGRYVTPSEVFWAAHLVFWWTVMSEKAHASAVISTAFATTTAILVLSGLAAQVRAAADLKSRGIILQQNADALLTGLIDPTPFEGIFDDKDYAMSVTRFLREHRLSIFADQQNDLLHRPVESAGTVVGSRSCLGAIAKVSPAPELGPDALTVNGRAWNLMRDQAATRIFIVDERGAVVGYGSGRSDGGDKAEWKGYAVARPAAKLHAMVSLGYRKLCGLDNIVEVGP